MDNTEYKLSIEEIRKLISRRKYKEAMHLADRVDWRKERSSAMLINISKLYKKNKKYEEARDILLIAFDKYPRRTRITFLLCEIYIDLKDIMTARNYYNLFCEMAPGDTDRYILQYKLYGIIGVGMEERISILEEYKRFEYSDPRWAYELAYLYHMDGQATKCIEECDEMIRWFGDGKFSRKAMELKMLHEPLTPEQQLLYENGAAEGKREALRARSRKEKKAKKVIPINDSIHPSEMEKEPENEMEIKVQPVNVDQYATINLQKELGENILEVLNAGVDQPNISSSGEDMGQNGAQISNLREIINSGKTVGDITDELYPELSMETEDIYPGIKDYEMNDQEIYGQEGSNPETGDQEVYTQESNGLEINDPDPYNEIENTEADDLANESQEPLYEETTESETYFEDPDTIEMPISDLSMADEREKTEEKRTVKEFVLEKEEKAPSHSPRVVKLSNTGEIPKIKSTDMRRMQMPSAESIANRKNEQFDDLLSQEADGQISMVVSEPGTVEKQITGQLSIQDILQEWEKMKKKSEQEREKAIRQKVKQQTSEMFSEFDAATKEGILADLNALAEENAKLEEEALKKKREKEEESRKEAEGNVEKKSEHREKRRKRNQEKQKEKAVPFTPRNMTAEERRTFASFIQTHNTKEQIMQALDGVTMASYTGNIIVTGDMGMDSDKLAKTLIREIKSSDSNLTGKVASISGKIMNTKNIDKTFFKFAKGAVIINKAGEMEPETIENICRVLEKDRNGIIAVLEDSKINIAKMLETNPRISEYFNLRVDIEAMDNDTLVSYGKKYAIEKEYDIDDLGVLALYTRIADMQTSEHSVNRQEVKEIVDEAIYFANKKNMTHFMDILFSRRYNNDDMIVLRERDFSH